MWVRDGQSKDKSVEACIFSKVLQDARPWAEEENAPGSENQSPGLRSLQAGRQVFSPIETIPPAGVSGETPSTLNRRGVREGASKPGKDMEPLLCARSCTGSSLSTTSVNLDRSMETGIIIISILQMTK